MTKKKPKKRGRPEERLKIEGDWKDALAKALKKKPTKPAPKSANDKH